MGNFASSQEKPEILSDVDENLVLKLYADIEDGKFERLSELSALLKKLKQDYELWNFNFDAFVPPRRKHQQSKFFIKSPIFAGNAYLMMLFLAIAFTEGKAREYYLINYERYCLYLVERLEAIFATTRKIDFLIGAIDILFKMVVIGSLIEDTQRLIVAYRRMLNLVAKKNIKDFHQLLFRHSLEGPLYPDLLSKFINDGLFLVESGHRIFGNNPYLIDTFLSALTYAQDDEPCLMIGETGTGKEIVARILHRFSRRRDNNFQARNCGNFTLTLFDSELMGTHWSAATNVGSQLGVFLASCGRTENNEELGYTLIDSRTMKGQKEISFARSSSSKVQIPSEEEINRFAGTVFLDEINSLPLELQSKLLRIIEQKEVNVLGESKSRRFKAKVICASNKDPKDDHEGKILRRDLYYRVSRGVVELPPLRKIRESIPDLALHMIRDDTMNVGFGKKLRKSIKFDDEALDILVKHDWPGNIRELENVLYRALKRMRIERTRVLESRHLDLMQQVQNNLSEPESKSNPEAKERWTDVKFTDYEALYMKELFQRTDGNVLKASKISGRGRTAVENSWIKLGLKKAPPRMTK